MFKGLILFILVSKVTKCALFSAGLGMVRNWDGLSCLVSCMEFLLKRVPHPVHINILDRYNQKKITQCTFHNIKKNISAPNFNLSIRNPI